MFSVSLFPDMSNCFYISDYLLIMTTNNNLLDKILNYPNNKDKNHKYAIEAWNTIKKPPGSNRYVPEY